MEIDLQARIEKIESHSQKLEAEIKWLIEFYRLNALRQKRDRYRRNIDAALDALASTIEADSRGLPAGENMRGSAEARARWEALDEAISAWATGVSLLAEQQDAAKKVEKSP